MSHKIKSGSIKVNPVDLQQGSVQDQLEDRSSYLRSDEVVTWTGTQLEFTTDIILEIVHSSGGTVTTHTVQVADSPIVLADLESAWVSIDRSAASENLTLNLSGTTPIPAHSNADKDVIVLFRRVDAAGPTARLHIPLHKQVLDPGQAVILGASGAGGGGGASLEEDIKRRLVLSPFDYATPNIFEVDEDDKVDGSSTGAYDGGEKAFKFTGIGDTLVSTQNLDTEFLNDGLDVNTVELYLKWVLASIDTAATYEVSRDGGNEYQAITMERIGETNAYRGLLTFADEAANQDLDENAVGLADATEALTDTGSNQKLSQEFTPSTSRVMREIEIYLNKIEAVAGNVKGKMKVQIVADDTGSPSTSPADILSESDQFDLEALATGDTTNLIEMPRLPLVAATKYHIVLETDAEYKANYVAATDEVSWRSDTAPVVPDGQEFNGTVWAAIAGSAFVYKLTGRELDLRVRVTGGTTDALMEGYGLFYGIIPGLTASGKKQVQKFFFTGDENRTEFVLDQFTNTPDPDLLTIYDAYRGQTYIIEEGVARLDGQTITFDPDFFDFPGEDVLLVFKQNENSSFDDSDDNANAISAIQSQLIDIGDELESISDSMVLPRIPAPYTDIVDRAMIPDFSQDMKPRFGVDREHTVRLSRLNEKGSNGQTVFKAMGDKFDQTRFVGNWLDFNNINGTRIQTSDHDDPNTYSEYTFNGTGLNILIESDATSTIIMDVDIDGSPTSTMDVAPTSGVLLNRNGNPNQIINIASGLAPDTVHTVRIKGRVGNSGGAYITTGYEILHENAAGNIRVASGQQLYKGKRLIHSGPTLLSYNSGFETGTLGVRGGSVKIYQKADGSVAHAVNPTDASAAFLGAANHANETVSSTRSYREYGDGLSTDFQKTTTANADKYNTLSDGSSSLVGNDVRQNPFATDTDNLFQNANGSFHTITFTGTGLDILFETDSPHVDTMAVTVDGVSVGNLTTPAVDQIATHKICSGLPYGTHKVRISRGASTNEFGIISFTEYVPKLPETPTGAKEIGSYNILADFVANATSGGVSGDGPLSTGILRKACTREILYDGAGWNLIIDPIYDEGTDVNTIGSIGASATYYFFGTGFDLRFLAQGSHSTNVLVDIDGSTDHSSLTTSFYGLGVGFTAATGILDMDSGGGNDFNSGLSISGLSLGLHKVIITNQTTARMRISSLDIITPIHSPKTTGSATFQNTSQVGSQGILDLRRFSKKDVIKEPQWSMAEGVDTSQTAFSLTTYQPVPDMFAIIETDGGPLEIHFESIWYTNTAAAQRFHAIFVDGVQVEESWNYINPIGDFSDFSMKTIHPIGPGRHLVQVMTKQSHGSSYAATDYRNLIVKELKNG